ncbi:MAG: hypothetical protein ACR2OU_20770, partial [Thermomicrobiales bacterium]
MMVTGAPAGASRPTHILSIRQSQKARSVRCGAALTGRRFVSEITMASYIARRLLQMIPVMFLLSLFIFFLIRL